jgi:hypothetical protein
MSLNAGCDVVADESWKTFLHLPIIRYLNADKVKPLLSSLSAPFGDSCFLGKNLRSLILFIPFEPMSNLKRRFF